MYISAWDDSKGEEERIVKLIGRPWGAAKRCYSVFLHIRLSLPFELFVSMRLPDYEPSLVRG